MLCSTVVTAVVALGAWTWSERAASFAGGDLEFARHAAGYDAVFNRLVVYHWDAVYSLDLNATGTQWQRLPEAATRPSSRHSMVYGVDDLGLVVATGESTASKSFFNDVWRFDFRSDLWTRLDGGDPGEPPQPRYGATGGVHYDGVAGRWVLTVTHGFAKQRYSNAFAFDLGDFTWSQLAGEVTEYVMDRPHARCLAAGGPARNGDVFLMGGCLSGGKTGGPCPSHDAWCRAAGGGWARITDGQPTPRVNSVVVPVPGSESQVVMLTSGGVDIGSQWLEGSAAPGGDVAVVDCAEKSWTFFTPAGPQPPRTQEAAAAFTDNSVMVVGGRAMGTTVWVLTPDASGLRGTASASGAGGYLTLPMLHGVFMFLGWGVFIPAGHFSAHFFRHRDPLWFQVHRLCMSLGLLFAVVGFGLIVPSPLSNHFQFAHGAIGLVVMLFGILQPANAFIRPHKAGPDDEKYYQRQVWEFVHKNSGRLAIVLALVNLVLGALIMVAPPAVVAVAIAWVVCIFLAHLGFEVFHRCRYGAGPLGGGWKRARTGVGNPPDE
ncbi:Cytochrome b561 [Diplonema papillatum]|nr:Cytochrome b561 [Diplonema papillatum]